VKLQRVVPLEIPATRTFLSALCTCVCLYESGSVFNVKRLVGRKFDDPDIQSDIRHSPFTIFNKDGEPYIRVKYRGEENEFVSSLLSFSLSGGAHLIAFTVA
jgi:hypothetical protein